jgi:hypothetical protein
MASWRFADRNRMTSLRGIFLLVAVAGANPAAAADPIVPAEMPAAAQRVPVVALETPPAVDGDLGEWTDDGWIRVTIQPAVKDDADNRIGTIEVQLRAGVHGDRFYFAARWPDRRADTVYKPWEWRGDRYRRGKRLDDMFAARFDLAGDYHNCMIADVDYRVDVWLWSAARSNVAGYADDTWQMVTTKFTENAAEYTGPQGKTVYIRKKRDTGTPVYANTKPDRRTFQGDKLPGIKWDATPDGSAADVRAKGVWADGHWQLEMSRALVTGHDDDAELPLGAMRVGAVAVFDRNSGEHKSVSGDLHYDFSALR